MRGLFFLLILYLSIMLSSCGENNSITKEANGTINTQDIKEESQYPEIVNEYITEPLLNEDYKALIGDKKNIFDDPGDIIDFSENLTTEEKSLNNNDGEILKNFINIVKIHQEDEACWEKVANCTSEERDVKQNEGYLSILENTTSKLSNIDTNKIENKILKRSILAFKNYIEIETKITNIYANEYEIPEDFKGEIPNASLTLRLESTGLLEAVFKAELPHSDIDTNIEFGGTWKGCTIEHPKTDMPNLNLHKN